jgi:DNA-binding MarR family transcriptional regulator
MTEGSASRLPLSALLSRVLIGYTIEFDNEAERRLPHRTTSHGLSPGAPPGAPWLVSLVMWANCVRFVPDGGITLGELRRAARTATNLDGMRRWRYITLSPDPGRGAGRAGQGTVIRLTRRGREARAIWDGLGEVIDERWRERFGADAFGSLRDCLRAVVGRLDPGLPDCLPILGYGLWSNDGESVTGEAASTASADIAAGAETDGLPLWALLSRTLLAFATEFERDSDLSLAISANVLRVLTRHGVRSRDVPALAGVSKESVAMAMGVLRKKGLAVEEPDPAAGRGKVTRLTGSGAAAQRTYHDRADVIENRWRERFGADIVASSRRGLEGLTSRLPESLEPYPEGWRASVRGPGVLAHYPMVLHRGGYPDGS